MAQLASDIVASFDNVEAPECVRAAERERVRLSAPQSRAEIPIWTDTLRSIRPPQTFVEDAAIEFERGWQGYVLLF